MLAVLQLLMSLRASYLGIAVDLRKRRVIDPIHEMGWCLSDDDEGMKK